MNGASLRLAGLALLGAAAILAYLVHGSGGTWQSGLAALLGGGDPLERQIILELRLPRLLAAAAAGGLLALAGTCNQVLTRNPLADPYVLGVAGGAAVAALAAMLLGLPPRATPLAAMAGAGLAALLAFGLSRQDGWPMARLLLTGVMLASLWGALVALLLALAPPGSLPGLVYWLMGDLAAAAPPGPGLAGLALLTALAWPAAHAINILGRGELNAASLGVRVGRLQLGLFTLSALATGLAVATAGAIGFIGLAAPHLARRLMGHDHRRLLLAAPLIGALLLILADLAARTLLAPRMLPTGAVTALLGAPFFLYLLRRRP